MRLHRRLFLLLPVLSLCLGPFQDSRPVRTPGEPLSITIFLTRHAEKSQDDPRDPSLSEEGEARARALSKLVAHSGVTHLFSTEYRRTRDTLAPLATATGKSVEIVSAREPHKLVKKLQELAPGSVAVVSGHSNTVPALAKSLGVTLSNLTETERGPMLGEKEYDRLFVLTLPPAESSGVRPHAIELRY